MPVYLRTLLVTATPDQVDPFLEGHRRHVTELRCQGRLRFAAEFEQGDGFVEVFEAEDLLEADRLARSSPLVEAGMGAWSLREIAVAHP